MGGKNKLIVLVLGAVAIGLGTATVTSASSNDVSSRLTRLERLAGSQAKTIASLQARLSAVQTQTGTAVRTANAAQTTAQGLSKMVADQSTKLTNLANANACGFAVLVDALHITWRVIDALTTALANTTVFGPQTPVDDQGACAAIGVTRTPQSTSGLRAPPEAVIGALLRVADRK